MKVRSLPFFLLSFFVLLGCYSFFAIGFFFLCVLSPCFSISSLYFPWCKSSGPLWSHAFLTRHSLFIFTYDTCFSPPAFHLLSSIPSYPAMFFLILSSYLIPCASSSFPFRVSLFWFVLHLGSPASSCYFPLPTVTIFIFRFLRVPFLSLSPASISCLCLYTCIYANDTIHFYSLILVISSLVMVPLVMNMVISGLKVVLMVCLPFFPSFHPFFVPFSFL